MTEISGEGWRRSLSCSGHIETAAAADDDDDFYSKFITRFVLVSLSLQILTSGYYTCLT